MTKQWLAAVESAMQGETVSISSIQSIALTLDKLAQTVDILLDAGASMP